MNPKTDEQKELQSDVFAPRMKALRKALDVSQKEFSLAIGVSQASISMYESGAVGPNLTTIQKIVTRYPRINPLYLLGESDDMYESETQNKIITETLLGLEEGIIDIESITEENSNKELFERILDLLKNPYSSSKKTKQQEATDLILENQLLHYRIKEKEIQISYLNTLVENLKQQVDDLRKITKIHHS